MKNTLIRLLIFALNCLSPGLGSAICGHFKKALILYLAPFLFIFLCAVTGMLQHFGVFLLCGGVLIIIWGYLILFPFFEKSLHLKRPILYGLLFLILTFIGQSAIALTIRTFYFDSVYATLDIADVQKGDKMIVSLGSPNLCPSKTTIYQNTSTKALKVDDATLYPPPVSMAVYGNPCYIFYSTNWTRIGKRF